MTTYDESTAAVKAYDATLPGLDVLPEHNGERVSLTWWWADAIHGPLAGFLKLETRRDGCLYSVSEFPVSVGRGFYLSKFESRSGTDKSAEGYAVECKAPGVASCECRGWRFGGRCRHVEAVETLLANQWL